MLKIGIIKERKNPTDSRAPLSPEVITEIHKKYPNIQIVVESSDCRSFSDAEYLKEGIEVVKDVSDCAILMGVKEVPVAALIPNKTYFFFSHTRKKQAYNQPLMQALIEKNIRMIDYECLTNDEGARIIGFGFFAGVVGAHHGLLTYGKKHDLFELKPAHACKDMEEMLEQYNNIQLPPMKIAITGSGRVAKGLKHVLECCQIKELNPKEYLSTSINEPIFTHLKAGDLYQRKEGKEFDKKDFYKNPSNYQCVFRNFMTETNVLMNGIYWENSIDRLFEPDDLKKENIKMSVISDVTCDILGSVPINLEASTIANPVYGVHKLNGTKEMPFLNHVDIVDVIAVDNLPNELPRDATQHFGESIFNDIIPELLRPQSDILDRATICENGQLTPHFSYLSDYASPISV